MQDSKNKINVCIVGGGASGWMVATALKNLDNIKNITLIDSTKINSIGVGESTTGLFDDFIKENFNISDFIKESDASVKYGVVYKNWTKRDYLHPFQLETVYKRNSITRKNFTKLLLNKDKKTHIHDIINVRLWNFIQKNKVSLDMEEHPFSWHFNAAKFILFLKKENLKNKKINLIEETVVNCKFNEDGSIKYIITDSNKKIFADYYVNCCGERKLNENVFKESYFDISQYLLCDKALFYPLEYTNKQKQFHPYTIAKTMKNGWRWITPTWGRVGTGYVFSSKHSSPEKISDELETDIGKKNLNFRMVDFHPKVSEKPFKKNSCSIGMSQGFLEPLDAPGLSLTIISIKKLADILSKRENELDLDHINSLHKIDYFWWASFILSQYKNCYRSDTSFWKEQKNVDCPFYNELMNMLYNGGEDIQNYQFEMFFYTLAAKDINVNLNQSQTPHRLIEKETILVNHYDIIKNIRGE